MKSIIILTFLLASSLVYAQTDFPFTKFKQFSSETVNLNQGEYLIGVFNTNCDHCQQTASELSVLENTDIPKLYALLYNEIPEVGPSEFSAMTNTDYPFIVIGDNDFWTLLKASPPIIYHVRNGEILEYFEGDDIAKRINAKF